MSEATAQAGLDLDVELIELVEQTFAAVAPRGHELVKRFYQQLFEWYPDVQPLFEHVDMQQQRGNLLAALAHVTGDGWTVEAQ